jgi:peroxiredoxin family protein
MSNIGGCYCAVGNRSDETVWFLVSEAAAIMLAAYKVGVFFSFWGMNCVKKIKKNQ